MVKKETVDLPKNDEVQQLQRLPLAILEEMEVFLWLRIPRIMNCTPSKKKSVERAFSPPKLPPPVSPQNLPQLQPKMPKTPSGRRATESSKPLSAAAARGVRSP